MAVCGSWDARDGKRIGIRELPADLVGASWRGRWVSGMLAVRLGVEWLAVGPGLD